MNELALFAGAGGSILAGKLLGWRTVCAVEIDTYARSVLFSRQRDGILEPFPVWDDVRTFDGNPWRGKVDVITAGFPCQDISAAGKGAGITGARSGLWKEGARLIGEILPRYALLENSPMLTSRGLGTVLGDLAEMGFDAEWGVFQGREVGCPAENGARLFVLASANNRSASLRRDGEFPANAAAGGGWSNHGGRAEEFSLRERWEKQPRPFGVADGVAHRVERIRSIGNGWVPTLAVRAWHELTSRV